MLCAVVLDLLFLSPPPILFGIWMGENSYLKDSLLVQLALLGPEDPVHPQVLCHLLDPDDDKNKKNKQGLESTYKQHTGLILLEDNDGSCFHGPGHCLCAL